jgi:thiol-disulfide isomerase/thioredoxin
MKKSKIFILTALLLVGVMAFASCTAPATQNSSDKANKGNMAEDEMVKEETLSEKTEMDNTKDEEMAKEENMDSSETFAGNAYNFELQTAGGKAYKLSDLSGKKVYVKFWASWCSICLAGLEEIDELYKEYEDSEDVVILTMVPPGAMGEVAADKFKSWFSSLDYSFEVLMDEGGSVMTEYGIRAFPTSVFIDTSGNVQETKLGHVGNEEIKSIIDEMS